jgi:GAF domain-containing protein
MYGFESYASLPVVLGDGTFFGTLCAIDPAPNQVSTDAIVRELERLAREASDILSRRIA